MNHKILLEVKKRFKVEDKKLRTQYFRDLKGFSTPQNKLHDFESVKGNYKLDLSEFSSNKV